MKFFILPALFVSIIGLSIYAPVQSMYEKRLELQNTLDIERTKDDALVRQAQIQADAQKAYWDYKKELSLHTYFGDPTLSGSLDQMVQDYENGPAGIPNPKK